ncbi:MAG: endonuclease III [Anaerolineae bacterium]|nr:endonuclease III [Anaerolineae bacterium]
MMIDDTLRERGLAVHRQLIQIYGEPQWRSHMDPISELVSTILSQNTNDVNRDRAFAGLRARFPTWEAVRDADLDDLKASIRTAGLANHKAPSIQRALRQMSAERGELSLDFLRDLPLKEAKAWLTGIKGVGPKTAAIVLLFSLGRPAFPVDTHVHRVTGRIGLIGPKVGREQAHEVFETVMPPETFYALHLNLIRHGREVCAARKPRCEICTLRNLCDFGRVQSVE